jgi:hypothetical protein
MAMIRKAKNLQAAREIDSMLSPRPPTGLVLNPLMMNTLSVKFDNRGSPLQRSILGKVELF